jgi:hypothetical protein
MKVAGDAPSAPKAQLIVEESGAKLLPKTRSCDGFNPSANVGLTVETMGSVDASSVLGSGVACEA